MRAQGAQGAQETGKRLSKLPRPRVSLPIIVTCPPKSLAFDPNTAIQVSRIIVTDSRQTTWNVYCDSPPGVMLGDYLEWSAPIHPSLSLHLEDFPGHGDSPFSATSLLSVTQCLG
ncbi:hypothetical protein PAXRUDRAFT_521964 [Paxillus rubicundulus Ve08.2h10]|uniref:Uncharacterized protein n=1 Tax=Paxillus rubicundulus Ve08.2h10 TaxID=930991 RepID=A0A0D0E6H3_9AGAM|nr:hypothetical protein PAXRUDRAFT_521964 [Paxillus rubicundulus Ve08.2h10]